MVNEDDFPPLSTYRWRESVEVFEDGAWHPGRVEQAYGSDEVCRVDVFGWPGIMLVRNRRNIRRVE